MVELNEERGVSGTRASGEWASLVTFLKQTGKGEYDGTVNGGKHKRGGLADCKYS